MPVEYKAFDFADSLRIYFRNMPHWRQDECAYFVTFRLGDSIPQHQLRELKMMRRQWFQNHPQPWSEEEMAEYNRRFTAELERYLHAGYGACILRKPTMAATMENAMKHFNGARYDLGTYAIMPNHVHAVVVPYTNVKLERILHSWKGYTATQANKQAEESETIWNHESYDHIVRNENEMRRISAYILRNPAKAGLSHNQARTGGSCEDWICTPPACERSE